MKTKSKKPDNEDCSAIGSFFVGVFFTAFLLQPLLLKIFL